MPVLNHLRSALSSAWQRHSWAADPVETQCRLLHKLLRRAQDAVWGYSFGYAELIDAPDVVRAYQERVPLCDYEVLAPYVCRMRQGEADVLWPGVVRKFGISSGTASSGKILPATDEALRVKGRCSREVALSYLTSGAADLSALWGKAVTLPGRLQDDSEYPGNVVGEMSALFQRHTPAVFRHFHQAVPNDRLVRASWEDKLHATVERTVSMDVRTLVVVPTWTPLLFDMLKEEYREKHGRRPESVRDVWPNLRVIFSGGVALGSYRAAIEREVGAVDFIETYAATEGFFALQTHPDDTDMLLHLDSGVFYEFVRVEDLHKDHPRRYTVAEVEPDVRYALFVTTCAGLWSYSVGDVIRFTSTFPHRIVVAGRVSEMLDQYGEALLAEEARQALQHACNAMGVEVKEYHVAPQFVENGEAPSHQWFVEFGCPPEDAAAFSQMVDERLQSVNRHYRIRREAGALGAPDIVRAPKDLFYRWLSETQDSVSAQTKVPRMKDDRSIADQLGRLARDGTS